MRTDGCIASHSQHTKLRLEANRFTPPIISPTHPLRVSWAKHGDVHSNRYRNALRNCLGLIKPPTDAFAYHSICCRNHGHHRAVEQYADRIIDARHRSDLDSLPR